MTFTDQLRPVFSTSYIVLVWILKTVSSGVHFHDSLRLGVYFYDLTPSQRRSRWYLQRLALS